MSFQDIHDQGLRATRIFSGEEPTYTTMPTWHTTVEPGKAVVRYFDLDPDYYDGQNLYCIVSEGLAGVSLQIRSLIREAFKDTPFDAPTFQQRLQALEAFVVAVLLGTNTVFMPGRTLREHVWERAVAEAETEKDKCKECAVDEDNLPADEPASRQCCLTDSSGKVNELTLNYGPLRHTMYCHEQDFLHQAN